MKHIILEANDTDVIAFDLADLAACLNKLTDTRDKRGKIYPLGMLLTMIILAKLAGEDKPSGIAEWIRLRRDAFVTIFNCKHQRMPCLNIIRGVLQEVISIEELEKLLGNYLYKTYGGQQSRLVTMDGKTMRGTIPKGCRQGIHLMAAYLPEEGVVLRQVVVDSKENEISAAPQLVEALDLKNRVICGDAMQTQRQLSVKILAKGGDYLWFLKENQATLLADAQRFFEPPQRCAGYALPELPRSVAQSTNNGHGRLEKRLLTLMVDEQQFLDWPGAKQVFRLERLVKQVRTGTESTEVVYGITSCDPEVGTAKQMLKWTRAYWGIENGLHYRRDVTLHEDATRISKPNSNLARAIAAINNFIVALAQKLRYTNLASARRVFNARIAAQLF
jgi:predicted transposase YbfD/YdcC